MFKNIQVRDWIVIAALVGAAAVVNYRVGALEKQFEEFRTQYVRQDVFNAQLELVTAKIELAKVLTPKEQAK